MQLDPDQERAADLIRTAPIAVVTGGPGTGKTTSLKIALERVRQPIHLVAPTGKAAVRMSEATGRPAMTLHRFLGWQGGDLFQRDPAEPSLDGSLIVVDEASMVDVKLAAALFEAAPRARIVFVGDADQLPSVGPGSVLSDIIGSGKVPVVQLKTLHRAAQDSWVCRNAQTFNRGEMIELEPTDPKEPDFFYVDIGNVTYEGANAAVSILSDWDYDVDGSVQVLSPMRSGDVGILNLNKRVQEALNPGTGWAVSTGTKDGSFEIRVGDRVVNTKNNYSAQVMNGELGNVYDIPKVGSKSPHVSVAFEGHSELVDIPPFDLRLGYALTIHKAQGSEWPWVVVACHSSHSFMLSRRLIYTAITRAKKGVILIGDMEGIERALANTDDGERKTRLYDFLREAS